MQARIVIAAWGVVAVVVTAAMPPSRCLVPLPRPQVPIVKDVDRKGLAGISADVKALAAKAKDGKLAPAEFMGGTFTISNLGMMGVKQFAAIVNPPQAAILAVGSVGKKVVVKGEGYAEASVMLVTLSCDHRVIDGAMGAEWLASFKSYVESPFNMLL